jgi:putative endonuclease
VYYVYILKCSDSTLYTGITTDLKRRLKEHNDPTSKKGAKYTKVRRPVIMVYSKKYKTRSLASKQEYELKQLSRSEKLKLL